MKIDGIAYRSVWVDPDDGWSVHIIDQTKLPWSLEILRLTDVAEAAHAIRTMQVRGAPLIGAVAAYGLCLALRADASTEAMERDAAHAGRDAADGGQSALGDRAHADPAAQHAREPSASPPPMPRPPRSPMRTSAQSEAIGRHGVAADRGARRASPAGR